MQRVKSGRRLGYVMACWCLVGMLFGCNGDRDGALNLSGTVEAHETALAFQVSGRIERLLVEEGEQVKRGQEVALLVADDYEQVVTGAQAEVAAAQAALAALKAGTRKQELRVAEATLEQARAEQNYAQQEVQRVRTLITQKLVSQEQLDQAELRHDVARATMRRAKQQLLLLQEGPRQEDIDKAEAELAARRSRLANAERQLSYTRLFSPVDGTVTLRQAEAGEVIGIGRPVFKVADMSRPWVRAYLNETDLSRVRLGDKVSISVDGQDGRTFQGTLRFISTQAEFTPKSVETRELRVDLVYRIKVELENPEGIFKLGMPADLLFNGQP